MIEIIKKKKEKSRLMQKEREVRDRRKQERHPLA